MRKTTTLFRSYGVFNDIDSEDRHLAYQIIRDIEKYTSNEKVIEKMVKLYKEVKDTYCGNDICHISVKDLLKIKETGNYRYSWSYIFSYDWKQEFK